MEKLSFASAYRTAAILAAFSRASASSEEDLQVRPSVLVTEHQTVSGFEVAALACLMRKLCGATIGVCSRPCRDRIIEGAAEDHARWQAQSPAAHLDGVGRGLPRRRFISHFALCDEVEPGDPA